MTEDKRTPEQKTTAAEQPATVALSSEQAPLAPIKRLPTLDELRARGFIVAPSDGKGFMFIHPMGPIGRPPPAAEQRTVEEREKTAAQSAPEAGKL